MTSTTTLEALQNNAALTVYENLKIKRRFSTGYEASFLDISEYLLLDGSMSISKKLDFNSYGYGQVKTGTAKFRLDNSKSKFESHDNIHSLFNEAITRHYTIVRYEAGYKDEAGTNLNEIVFEGLINNKAINRNFENGIIEIEVLAYETILTERSIAVGTISSSLASDVIEDIITNDTSITDYINFDSANINLGVDIIFDDATKFEKKKVNEALQEIAQKTNSIFYVDDNQDLIFTNKNANSDTPFEFLGGASQRRQVNILRIPKYDDGARNIINEVQYTSGHNIFIEKSPSASSSNYGINRLELQGEDLTNVLKIKGLCQKIIQDNEIPKIRLTVETAYMPNVINFLGPCTVDFKPQTTDFGKNTLTVNVGQNINDGLFVVGYTNLIIINNVTFKYYGFQHNFSQGKTLHFLVQEI